MTQDSTGTVAASGPEEPRSASILQLESLYEAGDFREVDRRARALVDSTDPQIRERARALRDRVQIDPFVLWVWGGTVVLVFGIIYRYLVP